MSLNYVLPVSGIRSGVLDVSANLPGWAASYAGTLNEDCFYSVEEDKTGKFIRQKLLSDGTTGTYRTEIGADGTNSFIANFSDATDKGPSARQQFAVKIRMRVSDLKLDQSDQALLFQVHQIKLTAPTFSPVVAIFATDNGYYAQLRRCYNTSLAGAGSITQYYDNYCLGAVVKGQIEEFVITATVVTNPSNGVVSVYRNGVIKAQATQPTRLDISGGSGLYLKSGIYMPGWSSTGGASGRVVQTDIYEMKVGDVLADVA